MIKVLQVVGSMGYAGIESVIMQYYRIIDKAKIQFDFISNLSEGRFDKEAESMGAKVFHLPSKSKHPIKYVKQLTKIIRKNEYDIVHCNTNSASALLDLIASKSAGVKTRILHSHNSSCLVKWQHYLLKPLLPLYATDRIACSNEAGKWLFRKKDKFTILNNSIDIYKYDFNNEKRDELRKLYNWQNNLVLGHVGSFQERKNQKFLIELLPDLLLKVPNAKLVFIGDYTNNLGNELTRLVEQLGLKENVDFLGLQNNVDEFLQAFDIFCFPSLFEGLSVAYLEASCCGLPVLISDTIPYVNITDNIFRLSLQKEVWITQIVKLTNFERKSVLEKIVLSEYNIYNEVKKLENIYTREKK